MLLSTSMAFAKHWTIYAWPEASLYKRERYTHYVHSACIAQRSYIKGDINIKWFMEEWFRFQWPWVFKGVK
jgi:hypothetical protein